MARKSKAWIGRIMVTAWVATLASVAPARAEDVLDRDARFHISASPLATALIDFSSQSGIQVAAADADVSRLNANGVSGTLPIRAALRQLLQGTGLEFSRVGAQTVAIRVASAGPAIGAVARMENDGAATTTAAPKPPEPAPSVTAGAPREVPDVTVTAPQPPTAQELAGDSLSQFIVHHATVHYVNTGVGGNLAHWRGGMQSICPKTAGLDPAFNAYVTARIRAVAAKVGAPVQTDPHCKDNVDVLFTAVPQEVMTDVDKWASVYFRGRYGAMRRLMEWQNDKTVQGWYITTSGGARVLNTDLKLVKLNVLPLWPRITPKWFADEGDTSGIGTVILAFDTSKAGAVAIETIADYAAVLALTLVQSPDHCDPLPSILDVMSPGCARREMPKTITAGDLAFLKALYYRNAGLGRSPSRDDIQYDMTRQFRGQ